MTLPTTPNPRPLPASSCLRLQFRHKVGSDVDVLPGCYLGFSGGPPTAAQLQTFATALNTEWANTLMSWAGPNVTFNETIVQDISTLTGFSATASVPVTGTRPGGTLPAATCLNVNFSVARRYRGGKPRVYLPLGTETDLATPQTWTGAFVGDIQTSWTQLMTWCTANPPTGLTAVAQVNVSWHEGYWQSTDSKGNPKIKPNYRTPAALVDVITGVTASATIGSQRRRNHGGG